MARQPCSASFNLQGCLGSCRAGTASDWHSVETRQTADPLHVPFLVVSAGCHQHLCQSAAGESTPAASTAQHSSSCPSDEPRPPPAHSLTPRCALFCPEGCPRHRSPSPQVLSPTPHPHPRPHHPHGRRQPRCCYRVAQHAPAAPPPPGGTSCLRPHKHGTHTAGLRRILQHHRDCPQRVCRHHLRQECQVAAAHAPACMPCC